jgi:tripartite-type tricarboxylate transporter receptor subunit TctC
VQKLPCFVVAALTAGLLVAGASGVWCEDFPRKPVRMLSGETGGQGDTVSRLIAQGLSGGGLAQNVIVDNRPSVGMGETLAKAPKDGYTLLIMNNILWVLPLLQNVGYNPLKDFAPITLLISSPNILVVHPSVPARSVKDLIALAKAKPGELNYGSGASGSSNHLSSELFNSMAGVNTVRISYKGSGPALNALITNQVHLMFPTAGAASPHVRTGRIKALAVASETPFELLPDLPTVASSGLPGYESVSPFGLFAPAGTPAAIVRILNRETVRVLERPDVKERIANLGSTVVGGPAEQLESTVKSEIVKWGKVIKDAGIHIN